MTITFHQQVQRITFQSATAPGITWTIVVRSGGSTTPENRLVPEGGTEGQYLAPGPSWEDLPESGSSDGTVRYRVPLAFSADVDPASLPGVYAAFVSAGDKIAIFAQATSSRNGLYTVNSDKTALIDKHTWDLDDVLACTQVEVYGGVMTSFGFVRGEQNLQVVVPESGPPALVWPDVSYQSPAGVALSGIHDDIAALQPITNLASFQQASPEFAPTKALRLTGGDGWSITPQPPLPTTSAELMLLTRLDPHNETEDRFYELIAIEAELQTPTSSWDTYEPAILVNEDATIDLFTDGTVPGGTAEIQGHVVPDPPITYGEWIRLLQRTTFAGADTTIEWWREVTVDWDLVYEGRRWRRLSDDIEHPELTALLNQRYRTVVGKQFVGDLAEWDYRVDGTPVAGWTEANLTVGATSITDAYGNTIQRNGSGSIVSLEAAAGPDLSDDDPEALGTADPGTSNEASRSDHVHPLPSANGIVQGPLDELSINDPAMQAYLVAKIIAGANIDISVNEDDKLVISVDGLEIADVSGLQAAIDAKGGVRAARYWGTASDGDQTISGTTVLSAPLHCHNLHVTGTLYTANFPVYCTGTLSGNGSINGDGTSATTNSGPAAWGTGTLGASAAGTAGATGAGSQASALTNRLGGAGGAGGNGSSGSGGAAQTNTAPTAAKGSGKIIVEAFRLGILPGAGTGTPAGGIGGSGGGGDGSNAGGAGGAGGTLVHIAAETITFTGTISAKGGNGASRSVGNVGGGAGAGGGVIVVETDSTTQTFTTDVSGGTGGTKAGTGTNGSNGSAGTAIVLLGA